MDFACDTGQKGGLGAVKTGEKNSGCLRAVVCFIIQSDLIIGANECQLGLKASVGINKCQRAGGKRKSVGSEQGSAGANGCQ